MKPQRHQVDRTAVAVVGRVQQMLQVQSDPETGEPRPYLHVRGGLEARIARPVFYELVEMAKERQTPEGLRYGVTSNGAWFDLGPAEGFGA